MGIENRPYVGTWQLGLQEVVQHTPDALVYVNGDTAVPGCPKCSGRIDLQEFITEVSVSAGTDHGAASASFSLSIPLHHTDSFARDAKFILRPGLEIHIYMRGYFPAKGMYTNLAESQGGDPSPEIPSEEVVTAVSKGELDRITIRNPAEDPKKYKLQLKEMWSQNEKDIRERFPIERMRAICQAAANYYDIPPEWIWGTIWAESARYPHQPPKATGTSSPEKFPKDTGIGLLQTTRSRHQSNVKRYNKYASQEGKPEIWWEHSQVADPRLALWEKAADFYALKKRHGDITPEQIGAWQMGGLYYADPSKMKSKCKDGKNPTPEQMVHQYYADPNLRESKEEENLTPEQMVHQYFEGPNLTQSVENDCFQKAKHSLRRTHYRGWLIHKSSKEFKQDLSSYLQPGDGKFPVSPDSEAARHQPKVKKPKKHPQSSFLGQHGLQGSGVEDVMAYPYYHVFHGVVSQVGHSWAGGINTVSVQCVSMLHFWEYHRLSTNASLFGARPKNSKLKTSMVGHNFTGMHPYQIIWSLYYDMVGAAGGVGWAYSHKTNQTAKSEIAGESLFSLNVRYWKRRFDTEMMKLRFHGASGELFSTAQAAFLGTTSSANLTQLIKGRFADPGSRKLEPGLKGLLEQSTAVGLQNSRRLEALRFGLSRPTSKNSTHFELNLVEMQAYVSNVSNWGQFQQFESTYESKMDLAVRVCEVTGFEFYQDVDGDFVFKPPMYNMDTSDSRVYRIEDIDIINISFDEKEPEVTYMTVKGSQGKNIEFGVDNEWGHRGQYIDYRLVAKFGWRPHDFEVAYLNDAKSMFFSAVNRMDILNAPVNSASVTIPIRPELRPGYPVYIPYLDAFYYCTSFSHSFSVGGQCTTSLDLIAKRSKFYAPGKVGPAAPVGIDAIDLSKTYLPERPLQVLDNQGRPRLSGFPNVVMALDPDDINEMFFVVGNDLENIGDPRILKSLLKRGRDMGLISFDPVRGTYRMKVETGKDPTKDSSETQWVEFYLQDPDLPSEAPQLQKNRGGGGTHPVAVVDIEDAVTAFKQRQVDTIQQIKSLQQEGAKIDQELLAARRKKRDLLQAGKTVKPKQKAKNDKALEELSKIIDGPQGLLEKRRQVISQIGVKQAEFDKKNKEVDKTGVSYLVSLFRQVGGHFLSKNSDLADLDSTVNLLDMLSDKKATFSNGSQPGAYRYFSCSHPDPSQQGQSIVLYNQMAPGGKSVEKRNAYLDPVWQGQMVDGYLPTSQVTSPFPGVPRPEAQLGKIHPTRGIRVLTANRMFPNGEVLPTSEIRELMFSVQEASVLKKQTSVENFFTITGLPLSSRKAIQNRFTLKAVRAPSRVSYLRKATPKSLFADQWLKLEDQVQVAVSEASKMLVLPNPDGTSTSKVPPNFEDINFPDGIQVGNVMVSAVEAFGGFRFRDNRKATKKWGPSGSAGQKIATAADRSGVGLAKSFFSQLNHARKVWVSKIGQAGFTQKEAAGAAGVLNAHLMGIFGVPFRGTVTVKKVKTRRKNINIHSPVFPVSDARGYEVVGSYRYGRGVSIEPQNIFQGMHFQDIFSFLDKQTVLNILNAFVRKQGQITGIPQRDAKGKIVRDAKGNPKIISGQATNPTAQNALERHLLGQLRKNLTNKQILDLLGVNSSDPNALEGGLRNWIADKLKDGIQKVPVINAAYSLADLNLRQDKRICSCKGAEADVLLSAFSEQDFVSVTSPGDQLPDGFGAGGMDKATQYLTSLTVRASKSWEQSQAALRGQVPDREGAPVINTTTAATNSTTNGIGKATTGGGPNGKT